MRNGSFTVNDLRLYDETRSSKGRSPAAHTAQNVTCVAAPSGEGRGGEGRGEGGREGREGKDNEFVVSLV